MEWSKRCHISCQPHRPTQYTSTGGLSVRVHEHLNPYKCRHLSIRHTDRNKVLTVSHLSFSVVILTYLGLCQTQFGSQVSAFREREVLGLLEALVERLQLQARVDGAGFADLLSLAVQPDFSTLNRALFLRFLGEKEGIRFDIVSLTTMTIENVEKCKWNKLIIWQTFVSVNIKFRVCWQFINEYGSQSRSVVYLLVI